MAKFGSSDVKVEVDNAAGSLVDLSQYIDSVGEVNISAALQDSHAMGDAWVERLATGLKQHEPIELEGFYDDTDTTGPNVVLHGDGVAIGATRTLKITFGGTKSISVETIITAFRRAITRGELTRFVAVLTPTGAVTEV